MDILDIGTPNLASALSKIQKYNLTLLAEKIETHEEYQACLAFPFTYFQGYFFEKPLILSGKRIEPNTVNAIRVINCIHETDEIKHISQNFRCAQIWSTTF